MASAMDSDRWGAAATRSSEEVLRGIEHLRASVSEISEQLLRGSF